MITFATGNAANPPFVSNKVNVIVHIVNNIGVWGRGFVLSLNDSFPEAKAFYLQTVKNRGSKPSEWLGECITQAILRYDDPSNTSATPPRKVWMVAHLFAQHNIKTPNNPHPIKYDALRQSLTKLKTQLDAYPDTYVIHMPRIGCGLAGGNWETIETIINETIGGYPVTVYDLG